MIGVRLAEVLVNLDAAGEWDDLRVRSALADHLVRVDRFDGEDLAGLREWTTRLRSVFAARSTEERGGIINDLLAVGVHQVRLATHDGLPQHLHFVDADRHVLERVQAMTIGGIAIFAVESRVERMGVCERPGCDRVFIDTSRNGRRSYCTALCGNAHAVQRYRQRGAAART